MSAVTVGKVRLGLWELARVMPFMGPSKLMAEEGLNSPRRRQNSQWVIKMA